MTENRGGVGGPYPYDKNSPFSYDREAMIDSGMITPRPNEAMPAEAYTAIDVALDKIISGNSESMSYKERRGIGAVVEMITARLRKRRETISNEDEKTKLSRTIDLLLEARQNLEHS